MKSRLSAIVAVGAALLCAYVPADEPNPEAAKAIQQIAARRAAKEEARVRQVQSWAKGAAMEHRSGEGNVFHLNVPAGAPGGAVIHVTE